jgi:hypothetical protein
MEKQLEYSHNSNPSIMRIMAKARDLIRAVEQIYFSMGNRTCVDLRERDIITSSTLERKKSVIGLQVINHELMAEVETVWFQTGRENTIKLQDLSSLDIVDLKNIVLGLRIINHKEATS